jgi:hypothetical protein
LPLDIELIVDGEGFDPRRNGMFSEHRVNGECKCRRMGNKDSADEFAERRIGRTDDGRGVNGQQRAAVAHPTDQRINLGLAEAVWAGFVGPTLV